MSVIFSRQCEYALQAILYMSAKDSKSYTDIKEISHQLEIPHHFLAKILQGLSKSGLLKSQKGPSGGFILAKNPNNITLFELVVSIDGDGFLKECILGLPNCGDENPCPVHQYWGKLRSELHRVLAGKTIAEVSKEIQSKPQYKRRLRLT